MARAWDQRAAGVSQLTAERGQSAVPAERAVQIVDFKPDKRAVLNEREIQRIIKRKDLPTVVVSIGGVARSGKSFLLNLLVHFLSFLEVNRTGVGWENSTNPIEGVNWAQSRNAVTLGIWMWSKQFVIERQNGKKVAVLLVDSQGTGDNKRSDPKLDSLIMYISLQMSSFQLINVVNYLRADELTSLQLCADYADIYEGSNTGEQAFYSHLFNNLVFAIRNSQDTDRFGEDPRRFLDIKEECVNPELTRAIGGIERAFRHVTTFTFPYPGDGIAMASEGQKTWTLPDIPKKFLDPVKELAAALFTSNRMPIEDLLTGFQVIERFKILKMRLESTDLPEIGSPADALQETILYQAFSKGQSLYLEATEDVKRNLLIYKTEEDLRSSLESARDLALQVFCIEGHQHKYGDSLLWRKYEDMFVENCEKQQDVLVMKYNQDKKIADLERRCQEKERQIQEQAQKSAMEQEKLEREKRNADKRLEETFKNSEKREKDHQAKLNKLAEQMRTAKDQELYLRECERHALNIEKEKVARSKVDRMHNDRMGELQNTIQKLNSNILEQKVETRLRIAELQSQLHREKNRSPPAPPSSCSVM